MIHSSELTIASPALDRHMRTTYLIGLAPAIVSFALVISLKGKPSPLAWSIFGIAIATNIILYALNLLCDTPTTFFSWTKKIKQRPDAWLGKSLIISRNIFYILCFTAVWIGLSLLDVEFNTFSKATFYIALISWPIRNFCHYANYEQMPRWKFMLISLIHSISAISLTLFITGIISEGIKPQAGTAAAREMPIANIGLWIPAIFIIVLNILILLDDFLRHKEKLKT